MHLANLVVPSTSVINPWMNVTISAIGHHRVNHPGVDGIYPGPMNLEVTFHPNGNGIFKYV